MSLYASRVQLLPQKQTHFAKLYNEVPGIAIYDGKMNIYLKMYQWNICTPLAPCVLRMKSCNYQVNMGSFNYVLPTDEAGGRELYR